MTGRLAIEAALRAEDDRADQVRRELADAHRPALRVRTPRAPFARRRVVLLARDGRSLAAEFLLGWWGKRKRSIRRHAPVTTNEINRLAAMVRKLED